MKDTKNNSVLCVGEVLWDCFPTGKKPGGAPMNVAFHLNKFKQNVTLLSRVGNDESGEKLFELLGNIRLETCHIQTDNKFKTGEVNITLDKQKNASYEICKPAAWDFINLSNDTKQLAKNSNIVVYGTLASRNIVSRNTIAELLKFDNTKFIDVNLRPPYVEEKLINELIRKADIVKLNQEELEQISGWQGKKGTTVDLMRWFAKYYQSKILCLTKGANGASVLAAGEIHEHPGYRIELKDSVGAGDAFTSGFIVGMLKKLPISESLSLACATGAIIASKEGAIPHYDIHEVEFLLSQN